jgi:hypothetical protein
MAVAGSYKVESETPMGKQEMTITLVQDGKSLSGTSSSPMGTESFTGGTVDGDNFEFVLNVSSPMGDMKLNVAGAVNGNDISGKIKTQFGDMTFQGKRV